MRCSQPRQRLDGNWDFTCGNHPIGYCTTPLNKEDFEKLGIHPFQSEIDRIQNEQKYHTCGHKTKEEAVDCYFEYQLDNELQFHENQNKKLKCRVCKKWTNKYATLGNAQLMSLCDEHLNKDSIRQIAHKSEIIWES